MSFEIKRLKPTLSSFDILQEINDKIFSIQLNLDERLNKIENQLSTVSEKCEMIMKTVCVTPETGKQNADGKMSVSRLNKIDSQLQKIIALFENVMNIKNGNPSNSPVVLMSDKKLSTTSGSTVEAQLLLDKSHTVVTLNSEADYPQGTWLGDEKNQHTRVRVPIKKSDLIHINTTCLTPEKMGITLLDYLFPREVLAESNLSGTGKHNKMKLDPLLVYGIQCHLKYKFQIDDIKWFRIKQNMDAKCRALWRRKHVDGLSLGKNKVSISDPAQIIPESESEEMTVITTTETVDHHEVDGEVTKFELCTSELFPNSEVLELRNNFEDLDSTEVGRSQRTDFKIFRALPEHLTKFHFVPQEVFPVRTLPPPLLFCTVHTFSQIHVLKSSNFKDV
uniref:Protein BANP n=1 Tax=Cacopsylla melanoneura TaxID=428564 RepID=A0A8D8Z2L2_9HEMI